MKKSKLDFKNIIIVSTVILVTVVTAFFMISKHNADQKHYRGVFVINELCKL